MIELILTLALSAQANIATPLNSAAFDYPDADLMTYQVTRFELCVDGQVDGCAAVTPQAGKFTPDPAPAAGLSSYKIKLPPMTPGPHTISVKACNVSACSDPTPLVSFTMEIKPVTPIWRGFVGG